MKKTVQEFQRHDCGNPDCREFKKQCVFDYVYIILNEAHEMIESERIHDPYEAIEYAIEVLRGQRLQEDAVQQAQVEKETQKFSH